jgi:hypothetical protein
LEALRTLAALVRRLQEEAAQRGEEQHDAGPGGHEDASQGQAAGREDEIGVADVGELPTGGSAPTGPHDPASGTPPGGGAAGEQLPEEVREP